MSKVEITEEMLKEIERQVTANVLDRLSRMRLSGDLIDGGIIRNFGSTGIQDTATDCRVTIMDDATVVENNLIAPSMTIKGDVTIEGNLDLQGEIPTDSQFYRDMVEHAAGIFKLAMNNEVFLQYADLVIDRIKEEGLELSKIKLEGADITETFRLLQDSAIALKKVRRDVSSIGTVDGRRVILSSNSRNNIVLETDGSTTIQELGVGAVKIGSTNGPPMHEAERGSVMFNENAEPGQPVGWVSVGDRKWIHFGIIPSEK